MRDKYGGTYVPLVCGHTTTTETIMLTRQYARQRKCYCEMCGRWVDRVPKPRRKPLPDQPLF